MQLIHDDPSIPQVEFLAPSTEGYLLLAAEVDRRPPMLPGSARKRALLRRVRELAQQLSSEPHVLEAAVFDAKFFVPGQGAPFSRSRADAGGSRQRRFDVVVLVRTGALEHAAELRAGEVWSELVALMRASSRHAIDVVARNIRRINDVPHAGGGVYLFNFFDNTPEVLPVWENSARWFVAKTKLDNSIVLQPVADTANEYAAINHARWPTWRAFLPHLLLRPSFRQYVGDNSIANGVTAQPILYRQLQ